jgi:hypothetical protein
MPDTTTANYGFVQPEVGGSDDTWGDKLNADLADIDTRIKANETAIDALEAAGGNAAALLASLLTVDGPGSGLNADLLDGLEAAAFVLLSNYDDADVLAKIKNVDGAGSGLDADTLDGYHASAFLLAGDLPGEIELDPSLTAFGGLAFAADTLPYATGADAFALTPFTAFGRSIVGLADGTALATALGALAVDGESLASPGYIEFSNGFKIQWGSGALGSNAVATVNYPVAFTSFAIPVVSGGNASTGIEGDINAYGTSLTQASIKNSGTAGSYFWIAVGV